MTAKLAGALAFSGSPQGILILSLAGVVVAAAGIVGWRLWRASRVSAEELERRRRDMLMATGKMGDATLVEIRENVIFYSYDVRGIEYTASQDMSPFPDVLPEDPGTVFGPVAVKYDPRNPANSIIVSEGWSGIRNKRRAGARK